MEGLNIVELGNVCEETRGTLLIGVADPGSPHYFWPHDSALHVRKMPDVAPASEDGSVRSRTGT